MTSRAHKLCLVTFKLKKSIESQQLPWMQTMLTQTTKNISEDYGIKAFPTKVLIYNSGNTVSKYIGNDGDKFKTVLKQLLSPQKKQGVYRIIKEETVKSPLFNIFIT